MSIHAISLCLAMALGIGCGGEATVIGTHEPDVHSGRRDVGAPDIRAEDAVEDADAVDVLDAAQEPEPTSLADYQRCFSDGDCASGTGSCVKEVALNRVATNGTQSVAISEIFESLEQGEGICTAVCTDSPEICATLSAGGEAPTAAPHTCQLITEGAPLYPVNAPAFPFDSALNPAAQAAGQIFGAICRPPFESDPAVDAAVCATCQGGADSCGADAICWSLLHQERARNGEAGTCLRTCTADNACALGFACDIQDSNAQGYCRPVLDTCTVCRDLDGDGFGTGRCGVEPHPVTPDDCDDRNPTAYFDPDNMAHAFPASCGTHDLNCNGLRDDFEQIGVATYAGAHCTSCYDVCDGAVANGQLICRNLGDLEDPAPACTAQCERDAHGKLLFADCDGDISNGCEVSIDDISRQYYRDLDGDGYGDPNDAIFACDPSVVPAGYVDNALDCNDNSSAAHGGENPPAEICDGIDNDCNGHIDDADPGVTGLSAFYVDNDGDGFGSSIAPPIYACQAPLGFASVGGDCNDAQPHINPDAHDNTCNNEDTNCDGIVDNAFPQKGDTCTVGLGVCQNTGAFICNATQNNTTCSAQPHPAQYEFCDGLDNNCNGKNDEGCPLEGGTISSTGSVINRGGHGTNDKADDVDREIICPSGTVLVGIDVRERINSQYEGLAYAIDLQCRDLKIAKTSTYQYLSQPGTGNLRRVFGVGLRNESGTAWRYYRCPASSGGSAVYKMYFTHDSDGHVRGIKGHCRTYNMPTTPGASWVSSTIQPRSDSGSFTSGDPSKGSSRGPFECHADEAAVGMLMSGRATTRSGEDGMTKLQLLCKKLSFDTIRP